MQSPNYIDDPDHYKRLISKINAEANFPMYLHQNGYKLIKKSAGSMEFKNDRDRIVLQTARAPVTYFNRNDSQDKGLFFRYLMFRNTNFYKAVQAGLEIVNGIGYLGNIPMEVRNTNATKKSLEDNFTIAALSNSSYLRIQRGISRTTLNDPIFKGRIYNAYPNGENVNKIANIAFPKYDLDGNPQNYILYNKSYRSRSDNKIKKFRLVLNQKDHFLFHSSPIKEPSKIIVAESSLDLLSYHELHGSPDNFYVSFSGNLYQKKLQFFGQLTEPYLKSNMVTLISIMDNDIKGYEFDIMLFSSLMNLYNPNISVEYSYRNGHVSLLFNYSTGDGVLLNNQATFIEEKLTAYFKREKLMFNLVKWAITSDKILLEFYLQEIINTIQADGDKNLFKALLETISELYLPFRTTIHKSKGKDWNDDLRDSKKEKYIKMETVSPNEMAIGDKIELKKINGPHGTPNIGIIKAVHNNSVECDFGLKFNYTIPLNEISAHLKEKVPLTPEKRNEKIKKNNDLQNFIK
ncbi:DUF3991 domain-containing protein [Arenibacter certesii]|uniref:DUF3991 domain-containing protein n=1 Tax=Arenibacter certesii TaxID=228955 RepID=A0A918MJ08_9FLAO|nr:DUF3991 domain-containing protein [Arenibacter certesii]GGW26659.1 hypothetical protein GCM10007383_09870 [Arenibacter certesii]